jgi:hypothetical protein
MYYLAVYPHSCIDAWHGCTGAWAGGFVKMRERKQRGGELAPDDRSLGIRREDIEADIFELWIGISRLMARVNGSDRRTDAGHRGKRRPGRHR